MKLPAFLHLWGRSTDSPFSIVKLLKRACAVVTASVCGFVALALVALLAYRFDGFVRKSEFFTISEVRVTGASAPLEGQIRDALARLGARGEGNLALLHLGRARFYIESLPRVRKVALAKAYPRVLDVAVIERQPLAVASSPALLWLDRDGIILGGADPAEIAAAHAPMITGLKIGRPAPGERVEQPMLAETLAAISFLNDNDPAMARRFAEWHLTGDGGVTGILGAGVEVRFGAHDPIKRMPALVTAMQKKPDWDRFTYFDLRFDSQVVYF